MTRDLARQLKNAGFPIGAYRVGHVFYPPEQGGEWSERSRHHGVTITPHDLDAHMQDIRDGYYCPDVADLIDACGTCFARLWVSTSIWTAESNDPPGSALGDSAKRLWQSCGSRFIDAERQAADGQDKTVAAERRAGPRSTAMATAFQSRQQGLCMSPQTPLWRGET